MSAVKLPPIPVTQKGSLFRQEASGYQSSYKRDFQVKGPVPRVATRPTSTTRKHNPQPRHVFLLRRMFNDQPVCNVWTPEKRAKSPSGSSVALASKALMTCAQYSYQATPGLNLRTKPTRFGAHKEKLNPATGIVPVTSVWESDLQLKFSAPPEPLNMECKGKKRKLTAAYVMDQHLPLNEAIRDMRMRAEASKERYISQAVRRPSRRRLVHPRPSSLRVVGSVIRERVDRSLVRRHRGEFYSLHQPWPACYSCWAGPI